jgi:peptidyl-prolyl cis-trans isomerase C
MADNHSNTIPVQQVDEHVVMVNGVEIPEYLINEELKNYEDQDRPRERAAAALVIRHLLLEEIEKEGISTKEGEEAAIEKLMSKKITLPEADESARRIYFENNREQFRSSDLYEVSHILLATPPDAFEERAEFKEKATQLIEQLEAKPQLFETLAKLHSACPSKEVGGSLGQISNGSTVPEFERQVFSLPEGLHSKPIETRYGYHIIRVDRQINGEPLEYEMVSNQIAGKLLRQSQRQAISEYINDLTAHAVIHGIDIHALKPSDM